MSSLAQVVLCTASSLGVIAVTASAIATGGFQFSQEEDREKETVPMDSIRAKSTRSWKSLNNLSPGIFGSKYRSFFVSATDSQNEKWWEEKFNNTKSNGFGTGIFKDVDSSDKLKQICSEAYELKWDSNNNDFLKSSNVKNFGKEEVFTYCSDLGGVPKTIKDKTHTYNSGTIGSEETDKWVYAGDDTNDKFWDIRNDEFYGDNGFTRIIDNNEHYFFTEGRKNKRSIKDLCNEAYGKAEQWSEKKSLTVTAGIFCAIWKLN